MKTTATIILMLVMSYSAISAEIKQTQSEIATNTTKSTPKRLIIDTDLGWDDVLSILYILKHPDIEIAGITVTGCGEANLRWGKIIALTLMELGGRYNVPIALGSEQPLKYKHAFPQSFRNTQNDINGLIGGLLPPEEMHIDKRPAWKFLSDTINEADTPITILSLGGFTNIARMLQNYPDTMLKNIDKVFAMAGAVFVDGNISSLNNAQKQWNQGPAYATNHWAEWNVFIDPLAAKIVFDSEIPLTLIPLDACNQVMLLPERVEMITPVDMISLLAKNVLAKQDEGIPVPIFDPLAALIAVGGLDSFQYTSVYLDVITEEVPQNNYCGKTILATKGSRKINVVQGVSNELFTRDFCATFSK